MSPEPIVMTASALDHPCELHKYHWPPIVETEGHHLLPVYLQNKVYGRIMIPTLVWTCDNGHKTIHSWLSFMLGERRRKPFRKGTRAEMKAVQFAYDWYQEHKPEAA